MRSILFRADASPDIGFGHVSRCLSIAADVRGIFQCTLATRDPSTNLLARLEAEGVALLAIPESISLEEEAEWLGSGHPASEVAMCVDGYGFDSAYQRRLRGVGFRFALVDDLVAGSYHAHAILNHADGVRPGDYETESACRFYLGLRYVMIQPEFQSAEGKATRRKGWFVCLGGADPTNQVASVVERMLGHIRDPITVVLGAAYQHREDFEATFGARVSLRSGLSPAEMAEVMHASAKGVCSASTTALEFHATGGQLGLIQTADNQARIYQGMITSGQAVDWEVLLGGMAFSPPKSIPREGFASMFNYLLGSPVRLRPASMADTDRLLAWRNDPETVANSLSPSEVARPDHVRWLTTVVSGVRPICLWIGEVDGEPMGTCRSDAVEGFHELSWTVAPDSRGSGLGSRLVEALLNATPRPWRAHVLESNPASLRLARSFGLEERCRKDGVCILERS